MEGGSWSTDDEAGSWRPSRIDQQLVIPHKRAQHMQRQPNLERADGFGRGAVDGLSQDLQRKVSQSMPVSLTPCAQLAKWDRKQFDYRRRTPARAFYRIACDLPICASAIVPYLGDQRVKFPNLRRLAAAACDPYLCLDAPQVVQ
jgi:hypothetical protein